MNQYYYAENDLQLGPFTVDELKTRRLTRSTLVWSEGMSDWKCANEIEELKGILVSIPPTLNKKTTEKHDIVKIKSKPIRPQNTSSKYDYTYLKETKATFFGIILLIIPIAILLSGIVTFDAQESVNLRVLVFFTLLILRLVVTAWVIRIAFRQNRSSTGWGLFAFFLPAIALIVIGLQKKLRLIIELDASLPVNRQVAILFHKASQLFTRNRFSECIEILDKAIEIENENYESIRLRGIANFNTHNFQKAKEDFEVLTKKNVLLSDSNYYLGKIALLERNRELAISYFLKAEAYNNENAKFELDQCHNYIGNYLLESSQIESKLNSSPGETFNFLDGKYLGGLPQIDQLEKPGSLKTEIIGFEMGIQIELKRTFKSYHLAISYYEIDDIIFKNSLNLFEIHLTDKNVLTFSYAPSLDSNQDLKEMSNRFEQTTGKRTNSAYNWKE